MILGYTGPEIGMTPRQKDTVRYLFHELEISHLHHGDCVGGDAQAHKLAKNLLRGGSACVTIHPPDKPRLRAYCQDYNEIRHELPYLVRNDNIAREGIDGLVAAVPTSAEILRSGPWATVRYARKHKRRIWLVFPDGTFHEEPGRSLRGSSRVLEDSSYQPKLPVD